MLVGRKSTLFDFLWCGSIVILVHVQFEPKSGPNTKFQAINILMAAIQCTVFSPVSSIGSETEDSFCHDAARVRYYLNYVNIKFKSFRLFWRTREARSTYVLVCEAIILHYNCNFNIDATICSGVYDEKMV